MRTIEVALSAVEAPDVPGVPLALVISGVVVAGVGAGLHAWGAGRDREADALSGHWAAGVSYQASWDTYQDLRSDGETGAYSAVAMYVLGGALIVAGAVLWSLADGEPASSADAEVVLTPSLTLDGGGAVLSGRF